jgi:hypothetical protein
MPHGGSAGLTLLLRHGAIEGEADGAHVSELHLRPVAAAGGFEVDRPLQRREEVLLAGVARWEDVIEERLQGRALILWPQVDTAGEEGGLLEEGGFVGGGEDQRVDQDTQLLGAEDAVHDVVVGLRDIFRDLHDENLRGELWIGLEPAVDGCGG